MKTFRVAAVAAVVLAGFALGGCAAQSDTGSSPASSSIPTPVIAPVTESAGELQDTTVELKVGQVLNINTGDLDVTSYSGKVADTKVAEFTKGRTDGSATFNPGVTGKAPGTTKVVLSNDDGGIQDVTFTVTVKE